MDGLQEKMKQSNIKEVFLRNGSEYSSCGNDLEDPKKEEEKAIMSEEDNPLLETSEEFLTPGGRIPWIVTRSFQIAFWHCMRYGSSAVPVRVLYMAFIIQQLSASSLNGTEGDSAVDEEYISRFLESNRFIVCDATELLLRLALRKGMSFSQKKLESSYGDFLKVSQALCVLEEAQFVAVDWSNSAFSSFNAKKKVAIKCILSTERAQHLLSSYTGETMVPLFWKPSSSDEKMEINNDCSEQVSIILAAANSQDLRKVAAEMSRFCQGEEESFLSSSHKSMVKEGFSSFEMGIPTRRKDIVSYLMHRSYETWLVTNSNANAKRDVKDVKKKFVVAWNTFIGKVFLINSEVKYSVEFISRLFHIITSNFRGLSIRTEKYEHSLDLATIAESPGSLFHYYQRYVLDHRSKDCSDFFSIHEFKEKEQLNSSLLNYFFSWSTFSPRMFFHLPLTSNVELFSSVEELEQYLKALQLHAKLYRITDGAANFAKKLMGRDLNYVMNLFHSVMDFLSSFHDHHSVGRKEYELIQQRYVVMGELKKKDEEVGTISFFLYQDGLLAAHLLQFTPQYRLYACFELLFPLLESLRLYTEAVACLEILLYRPLFVLFPLTSNDIHMDFNSKDSNYFSIYYRNEKKGYWFYRLAMNLSHLKQNEKGLSLLKKVHENWEELSALTSEEKEYFLQNAECAVWKMSKTEMEVSIPSKRFSPHNTSASLRSVERRCRMLRALWPQHVLTTEGSSGSAKKNKCVKNNMQKVQYHAIMEFVLQRYCHRPDRLAIETLLGVMHKKIYRWTPLKKVWQRDLSLIQHPPVLHVKGMRDLQNTKEWKDSENCSDSYSSVEQMVLRHFLRLYSGQEIEKCEIEDQEGYDDTFIQGCKLQNPNSSKKCSEWKGLHCEGQWISLFAEILLRECLYADIDDLPSVGDLENSGTFSVNQASTSFTPVWLSRFQNGPLDSVNPIIFTHRRRRLIEDQLNFLEALSVDDYRNFIGYRCYGGISQQNSISDGNPLSPLEDDGLSISPTSEEAVPKRKRGRKETDGVKARNCLAPFEKVTLNNFPLLDMLSFIPRKSLISLLRCMFLGPLFEGFLPSTSGFPDLILWKSSSTSSSIVFENDNAFQLMEVKSPEDVLSMKQIAVNDTLLRCGFQVAVVKVHQAEENVKLSNTVKHGSKSNATSVNN